MVEFLSDIEPADWLAIAVNALGIMAAILVAAWLAPRITSREEKRSSQERLLRMLLNTWLLPAHQDYQSAIVLIPMEFQGNNNVLGARKQYLDHVGARFPDDPKQLERHHDETAIRQTALIEAIATALSIDIKAADLMAGRYLAQGFTERDALSVSAAKAWIRIADAMEKNNQLTEHLWRQSHLSGEQARTDETR